jgi:hypothetical protein
MNDEQLSALWAFSRGDLAGSEFEKWFFTQTGLENALGEDLHWNLLSENYSDQDAVWRLRNAVAQALSSIKQCECPALSDLVAIPMGSDFYFEKVFETLERAIDHPTEKWWLYISKCSRCATVWLIAQEERIYDEFFLVRSNQKILNEARAGRWPQKFLTYKDVLATGRKLSNPCQFIDPMAGSLQWTVEDLLKERPSISSSEIASLIGVSPAHASALIRKVQSPWPKWWPFGKDRSGI